MQHSHDAHPPQNPAPQPAVAAAANPTVAAPPSDNWTQAFPQAWHLVRDAALRPVSGPGRWWASAHVAAQKGVAGVLAGAVILAWIWALPRALEFGAAEIAAAVIGVFDPGFFSPADIRAEMAGTVSSSVSPVMLGLLAAAAVAGLVAVMFIARKWARRQTDFIGDAFVGSLAYVPPAAFLGLLAVLQISSIPLIAAALFVAMCYSTLLLYGGLRLVAGADETKAALLTPAAYLASWGMLILAFRVL